MDAAQAEGVTFSTPSIAAKLREWQGRERSKTTGGGNNYQAATVSSRKAAALNPAPVMYREREKDGRKSAQHTGSHGKDQLPSTLSRPTPSSHFATSQPVATSSNALVHRDDRFNTPAAPPHNSVVRERERQAHINAIEDESRHAESLLEAQLKEINSLLSSSDKPLRRSLSSSVRR